MIEYNGFKLYDCMPEGFRIDKTCGSPLTGYDFATNGKSVLNGQIRIFVKSNNYKKNNIEKEVKEDKIILDKDKGLLFGGEI